MTPGDPIRWHYAPGSGLLLGTGDRWLLLADQPEESVILELWAALTSIGLDQAMADGLRRGAEAIDSGKAAALVASWAARSTELAAARQQ